MARARNIKPSFFTNDMLGELDPLARLLFIGMWTIADYRGCFKYRPKKLKVELLPYDDCEIEALVNDLDDSGFITIYLVNGQQYIQIRNFEKHQNPHKNEREKGSDIPSPEDDGAQVVESSALMINRDKNGTAPESNGTDRADSFNPLTDSLNPPAEKPESRKRNSADGRFEEFWKVYPKHKARADALKAWRKLNPDDDLVNRIIAHVRERALSDRDWLKDNGQFVPNGSTFLNQERWTDEYQRVTNQGQAVVPFPGSPAPRRPLLPKVGAS